jgi:hypothetical protein
VIHGLLQTTDYALTVLRELRPKDSEAQIHRVVDLRMQRQFEHLIQASRWPNVTLQILAFESAVVLTGPPPSACPTHSCRALSRSHRPWLRRRRRPIRRA